MAAKFPLHVVVSWLGNSQLVARKHYLRVTDEHFARAAQNAPHEAQKEAQQASVQDGMGAHDNCTDGPENAEMLVSASAARLSENGGMGDEGIEHPPLATPKTSISGSQQRKCSRLDDQNSLPDPDLAWIVAAWANLPDPIKAAIKALLNSVLPNAGPDKPTA